MGLVYSVSCVTVHDDSGLAKGMAVILHRSGWQVYIGLGPTYQCLKTPSGEDCKTRIKTED